MRTNESTFNLNSGETYLRLLQRPGWYNKRKEILDRDNNQCCYCGGTKGLQVHHRQYHFNQRTQSFVKPWFYANHYLVTFCSECHRSGHLKFTIPVFNINPKF